MYTQTHISVSIYTHIHKKQRECHGYGQFDHCEEVQEYIAVNPGIIFSLVFMPYEA